MRIDEFQSITAKDVAHIMKQHGRKVVAFPFNGTRRWFYLEKRRSGYDDLDAYHDAITTRQIELSTLIFKHGVDTLLMPLLSPKLFESRGEQYTKTAVSSLSVLTEAPKFLTFYKKMDVRVRFYGDFKALFHQLAQHELLEKIERIEEKTSHHQSHTIYWGVCAHDTVKTVSKLTVDYLQEHQKEPDNQTLIATYYGQPLHGVDLFITASKFRTFDIPMLLNGNEDLYFTAVPSPYLTQSQFREILFDHLFIRTKKDVDYAEMIELDWNTLREVYQGTKHVTYGVGHHLSDGGIWVSKFESPKQLEPHYDF